MSTLSANPQDSQQPVVRSRSNYDPAPLAEKAGSGRSGGSFRPYYDADGITIYHGDCREIMCNGSLPKADLCLTDPPYGVGFPYASFDDTKDNLRKLVGESIVLILESSKVALITPGNQNLWMYPEPTHVLSWIEPVDGNGVGRWGFIGWHAILAYGGDPWRPYHLKCKGGQKQSDVIRGYGSAMDRSLDHPCPKPLPIWKKILLRGSPSEADLVFDPFCGSGTPLLAAKETGRRAIGIEIEERYCEIAANRLAQGFLSLGGGGAEQAGDEQRETNEGKAPNGGYSEGAMLHQADGTRVPTLTEEAVFEALQCKFVSSEKRNRP